MNEKRGINNRGQGLSVNAIILIVLGIVVLVLLIIGFTFGLGQFKSVRDAFLPSNAGTIAKACEIACSTNSQFDFCSKGRELKTDDKTFTDVTCNYLSREKLEFGVEKCASVSCTNFVLVEVVAQELLQNQCTGNQGKTIQALIGNTLVSFDCSTMK